jgi:hypothetical protein
MSTYIKQTKRPELMTTEELREAANQQAVQFYRDKALADPYNEAAQTEYNNYCLLQGIDPQSGKPSRFSSMSLAQIGQEWEAVGQKIEAQKLDQWRENNAAIWMASQPAYAASAENAAKLIAEIERLGLRGSVAEMEICFDRLVKHGDILPKPLPPVPVELPSMDDFKSLSREEMKAFIEAAGRKGIL